MMIDRKVLRPMRKQTRRALDKYPGLIRAALAYSDLVELEARTYDRERRDLVTSVLSELRACLGHLREPTDAVTLYGFSFQELGRRTYSDDVRAHTEGKALVRTGLESIAACLDATGVQDRLSSLGLQMREVSPGKRGTPP